MNHVVASIADSAQVTLPVGGVLAHELADDREDGEGGEREWSSIELKSGSDIDVVQLSLLQVILFRGTGSGLFREAGELSVCCVEGEGAGMVDGDGDFDCAVEIGSQS